MRLARQGFRPWIEENHKESKRIIDNFFSETAELCDDLCKDQFQKDMTSTLGVDFIHLFYKYMKLLRHENGKLSKFWLSYLHLVEILLGLFRESREGNWELHV